MIIPEVLSHDSVFICPRCNEMQVAKSGEFVGVYHECGERMEQMDCSKCNDPATRIVNCGQERQGYPASVETWITLEEPRCERHWRR